jgi:hypothetical protein
MVRVRMSVAVLLAVACLGAALPQAVAIEAAFVPAVDGGGDYLVRVEPDLVRGGSPYTFTSDVPADSRDVRRVKIYVADAWPPAVERSVIEASRRPRAAPVVASTGAARIADIDPALTAKSDKPWALLTGSLIALFLSLGANGYLGMLLAQMRARYLRDLQAGVVKA